MEAAIHVMRLHPSARLPQYATRGAAGLDLHAWLDRPLDLPPGAILLIPTGIAVAIPAGYVGLIRDRSGLALQGLHTLAGVIDSDYRGEVKIALRNVAAVARSVASGDRIAQMLILPCPQASVQEVERLPPTERGAGGFGSTGR